MVKVIYKNLKSEVLFLTVVALISLFCSLAVLSGSNVYADNLGYNVSVGESLNVTVTSNTVSLNLNPSTNPFDKADLGVSVGTNHPTGYKLWISAPSTDLTNTDYSTGPVYINTLANSTTESAFISDATLANYWGYRISGNNIGSDPDVTSTTNFYPFVSNTLVSSSSEAINDNAATITFASKVDYGRPSGIYNNAFALTAIANPLTYNITIKTAPGISKVSLNGTECTDSTTGCQVISLTQGESYPLVATLEPGYTFTSWDAGTYGTITNPTSATQASFTVGEGDTTITPSAEKATLYSQIASMSKGTLASNSVALSDTITKANSGVYTYDATTYGTASDASNDYPIYFYRGILDNTTGSYGSDGDAGAYPNYVRLGGNSTSSTCWRIVRTTGSGGVKMIYNGTWTGSTCANAQTAAQLSSTSAFDTTAGSKGRSIVGVGYTYNANYKSTTASTQAGTLFGTNSSYSGNTTDSTIKGNIDTWYNNNLKTNYGSHLEPSAGYCNDRSVNSGDTWINYSDNVTIDAPDATSVSVSAFYFGSYMRSWTTYQTVTLGCPRSVVDLYTTSSAANGNRQLTNPIALLTPDEADFAGSGCYTSDCNARDENSFLRSGSNFWLLSPKNRGQGTDGRAFGIRLSSSGSLDSNGVGINAVAGVRPVISLVQGTNISSGSGTATDPWEVAWQ